MNNNWACMFEFVEQKNDKVQKEQKFFYEKKNDEGEL